MIGIIQACCVKSMFSLNPVKLSDTNEAHQTETSSQVKDNKVSGLWLLKNKQDFVTP